MVAGCPYRRAAAGWAMVVAVRVTTEGSAAATEGSAAAGLARVAAATEMAAAATATEGSAAAGLARAATRVETHCRRHPLAVRDTP